MQDEFHWILVAAPGVPLAWPPARGTSPGSGCPSQAFTELKAQLDADAQTLRTLGAHS